MRFKTTAFLRVCTTTDPVSERAAVLCAAAGSMINDEQFKGYSTQVRRLPHSPVSG
jgi:hypothetical protein